MALTHFDARGDAHMVDVSDKDVTDRIAVAEGYVRMTPETLGMVPNIAAGDDLGVSLDTGVVDDPDMIGLSSDTGLSHDLLV